MDVFGNLLPILLLVLGFALRGNKAIKRNQHQQRSPRKHMENEAVGSRTERTIPRFSEIKKARNVLAENLRKELEALFDEKHHTDSANASLDGEDEETVIEQHIESERVRFERNLNTPGIVTNDKISDEIMAHEIGDNGLRFDRKQILDGIIMSEILGKPKALRR